MTQRPMPPAPGNEPFVFVGEPRGKGSDWRGSFDRTDRFIYYTAAGAKIASIGALSMEFNEHAGYAAFIYGFMTLGQSVLRTLREEKRQTPPPGAFPARLARNIVKEMKPL